MEKVASVTTAEPALFNSMLETGLRAVIILDAAYPKSYDLNWLTWLDYLVVHTADIDGPPSLHPEIPQRTGELLVRRRLIENSLTAMRKLHLVNINTDESGFSYEASDEATALVSVLHTKYAIALKDRAKWLIDKIKVYDHKSMENIINERINHWKIEFQQKTKTMVQL